jgi:pilus assembly protein CpaE
MSNQAEELHDDLAALGQQVATVPADGDGAAEGAIERARPVPRISIQVFCETQDVVDCIQSAAEDRRLAKTHIAIHMGGAQAAVAHYQESPTPNLIIVESLAGRDQLLAELDALAECCDSGTKVIVVGCVNDVILYRELLKRGVSEYLVTPILPLNLMESVSNLYNDPSTDPVGNVYAFIGAKGGVGSSTICHNASWILSKVLSSDLVIADLDLAFGTTGLDFNHDPVQGIAEALSSPERLDEVLLDRLLTKCSEHLSIFAAPVLLERDYDLHPEACESVVDVVRQNVPYVSLDLPHLWTSWVKRLLLQADEVIVTAAPDLANLRNAKNIVDLLKTSRQNDKPPHIVLNMTNMPKRPEISVRDFEQALDVKVTAEIEFDAETFGQAANNGQMIEELYPKSKAAPLLRDIAMTIANRQEVRPEKKSSLAFLERLSFSR